MTAAALVEACELTRTYGHVQALRGASLRIDEAQVVGLMGDNGAGKSTLVRMLAGADQPDSGRIRIDGDEVALGDPIAARRHGIETVYQDLALAPDLDAAANLFLGREHRRGGWWGALGWVDRKRMRAEAVEAFTGLGVAIPDVTGPIAHYSGGQRQGVAVARAAHWATRLLILDEPTAALGVAQTHGVLELIRRVRDSGIAVLLISHNVPEVLSVCDRITVLRRGMRVADVATAETSTNDLVAAMTGVSLAADAPRTHA